MATKRNYITGLNRNPDKKLVGVRYHRTYREAVKRLGKWQRRLGGFPAANAAGDWHLSSVRPFRSTCFSDDG
jgi:hypothetical protein